MMRSGIVLWGFFDRETKKVIPLEDHELDRYQDITDPEKRRVALDQINPTVRVSTVFLGLNHGYDGTPKWFETMIFGGDEDLSCWRYETYEEALAGHQKVVNELRLKLT